MKCIQPKGTGQEVWRGDQPIYNQHADKEKGLIAPMYKATARPHLEYRLQARRPYLRKNIYMLEKNTKESN